MAFELIFAFDEAISLGHKENVTVAQVKQYCEMESHEERLHKLLMQSKINETKDVMKRKASEIDKNKVYISMNVKFLYNFLPCLTQIRLNLCFENCVGVKPYYMALHYINSFLFSLFLTIF